MSDRALLSCPAVAVSRRTVLGVVALAGVSSLLGCQAGVMSPSRTSHVALSAPEAFGQAAFLSVSADAAGAALAAGLQELARRVRESQGGLLSLGRPMFDSLGLAGDRPSGLVTMESFPGDVFEPDRTGDAALVLVDGDSDERAVEALAAALNGLDEFEVRWQAALSRQENEVVEGRALNRNVFGFSEGLANAPVDDRADADAIALVAPDSGEPSWCAGGSYLAVRVLQVAHELWDADPVEVQEQIIGRRRDRTWLDGTDRFAEPDFTADPEGAVTPLDSHVRTMNPRDGRPAPRLLRRSWSFSPPDAGDPRGDGLLFMAFQADLDAGFRRVQERTAGDRLSRYALATGGGYFFVPPDKVRGRHWEDVLLT